MAVSRRALSQAASRAIPTTSRSALFIRRPRLQCTYRVCTRPALRLDSPITNNHGFVRRESSASSVRQVYDYAHIEKVSATPSSERVLIDVREPSEYADGFIPSAINVPIKSQPDALFLPAEEFEDRFRFVKPTAEKEVIFYCRSGVRSAAAAEFARQAGYQRVAEYKGSWLDWVKNGGKEAKP